MKYLKLNNSYRTIVDDSTFDYVNQWKWSLHTTPWAKYAARYDKGKYIYLHRFLTEASAGMQVDHINGNGLDNRISNLRLCTASQNGHNKVKSRGKSKYKGVSYFKGGTRIKRWCATIKVQNKKYHIGYFLTQEEAYAAYCKKSTELVGEFSRLACENRK